jgi:hypothetical protein
LTVKRKNSAIVALGLVAFVACQKGDRPQPGPAEEQRAKASADGSLSPVSAAASGSAPPPLASAASNRRTTIDRPTFSRLFRQLSEPDRYFFSDNFISNETSYLQVAPLLRKKAMKGGAYIGVGPEQNFAYLPLIDPQIAFIVDIRRQNALQHLLYKAIFEEARTRAEFLALLTGAPYDPAEDSRDRASLAELIKESERAWKKRDAASFRTLHARLVERIRSDYGIELGKGDVESLERVHQAFFSQGLALKFELHSPENRRDYPPFSELLEMTDPDGKPGSFLASEAVFRFVKELEQQNRIVPVVGDFAGDHALKAIARELVARDLPVSVFYVSNVEQYLLKPPKWQAWVENVESLPSNESSMFLRAYLDQGRRHPHQLKGHRTATVLQLFDHFRWRQRTKSYGGFWELVTDGLLGETGDAGG